MTAPDHAAVRAFRALLRPVCRLLGHRLGATLWEPGRNGYSSGFKRTVFCRRCGQREHEFARRSCRPLDVISRTERTTP